VPFVIRWPGLTKAGAVSDAIVSQIDLMATFAAYLGIDLPKGQAEDSFNLLPVLEGKGAVRNAVVHNSWAKAGFGIRQGDWVLIDKKTGYAHNPPKGWDKETGVEPDDGLPFELYNLKEDIGQRHDLAAEFPERVKALKELLNTIRKKGHPDLSARGKASGLRGHN